MKEILSYIKAKSRLNQAAFFDEMVTKFKDKNVYEIIDKLLMEGQIFEPRLGTLRYLG